MKNHSIAILFVILFVFCTQNNAQQEAIPVHTSDTMIWQNMNLLTPFRMTFPGKDAKRTFIDLDKDGDPDVLRTFTRNNIPVQWIDDDDDMSYSDFEGDMDNDCLMIDRNKDGKYGHGYDMIIDWNDEDNDGDPDMQVVADNSAPDEKSRFKAHYIWMIDSDIDNDNVFNFIDWNTFKIEGWDHSGRCSYFKDYHGQSVMLKAHWNTYNIEDVRYSWENPFLFYDFDNDGQTEMSIRFVDVPVKRRRMTEQQKANARDNGIMCVYSKQITSSYISIDLDNDNGPGNEMDYDFSLMFAGKGFDYQNQVHKYKSLKGLPGSEQYFQDPRWRQMDELIYAGHDSAYNLIFEKGEWNKCWFVFDEDDDCQRWERVEFYSPMDPFRVGPRNKGIDENPQADVTGDRGEWDTDFSGKGKLYIGKFDNKIHLYGAEWGAWRIDQNTTYFQGWQGWRGKNLQPEDFIDEEPVIFPTIKYVDSDENGFFDHIYYDLDGDKEFERSVSLFDIGISDSAELIDISKMGYEDFTKLFSHVADLNWDNALKAVEVAKKNGLNTNWYSNLMSPRSVREKYHYGYWLSFYLYMDLKYLASRKNDKLLFDELDRAYFANLWDEVLLSKN